MDMRRWVWVWGGGCDKQGCDVGGCGQVMECDKVEGVEREGVRKRFSSLTHIDMLHLHFTNSKYCTQ